MGVSFPIPYRFGSERAHESQVMSRNLKSLRWFRAAALLVPVLFYAPSLFGQIEIGRITGTVSDPSNARVPKTIVILENPLSSRRLQVLTDDDGQFQFEHVPYGAYILRITAPGFGTFTRDVNVRSNVPQQVAVQLTLGSVGTEVSVEAPHLLLNETPRTEVVIDENMIKLAPAVVRRDQLQALISSTPGWNTENDGLMHIRGVDDGTLFVVNGVPSPDRVDGLFAGSFNTDAITSLDIVTGNIPAEFGDRSGAVVVVQPKSGLDTRLNGTLAFGTGSFDSRFVSSTLGGGTKTWGLFFAGSGHDSDRFLDPVDPRNFNNHGGDISIDLRFDWHVTNKDIVRLAGTLQGANFRVPNNQDQEEAGQRQDQQVRHDHESVSWQHTWSPNSLFDISYFRNYFRSRLIGSDFDTPLTAAQNRHHTRQGMMASVTHNRRGHTIKAGVEATSIVIAEFFGFAITDPAEAEKAGISEPAMQFTLANPFLFSDRVARWTQAVYAQDDFSPAANLTISAGLRYDHSDLLISDQQFSPRIGAVYYIPATRTSLRGSFNRLYMPPQVENLLIASSQQARQLSPFADSGGGADISPEKLSAWEVGASQQLPKMMRLNVAYWWRRFRNIDDPNVLLGTTIVFPNSVARAKAEGLDMRLDVPLRKGFSAYFTYTNNQILAIGPLNGGLFLEDDFIEIGPGTRFTPDHDQRNAAAFALTYSGAWRGVWTSFTGRFESGVPLGLPDLNPEELESLPGANLVNLVTARVRPWYVVGWSGGMDLVRTDRLTVAAQVDIQNLADRDFVFNWGNPFSGTHFGYPRLVAGSLKFSFKK